MPKLLQNKLQSFFPLKSSQKGHASRQAGFTLIELLVVIGILGILASALVATIDPFEQLKKAQDANVKNALVEYLNAITRFYTTHNAYPWDKSANGGADCIDVNGTAPAGDKSLTDASLTPCTTALSNENEIKKAFVTDTNDLAQIFIKYDANNNAVIGCYKPQSLSQQKNKETNYTDTTVPTQETSGNTCKANGGSTNCYWCTK